MRFRAWALVLVVAACRDSLTPAGVATPESVSAQAISMTTIAVSWTTVSDADVGGYRLQRREDLTGPFETVAEGPLALPYFDTGLKPDTYYGYRVATMTKLGGVSAPSVVGGARTPPLPGILVRTHTLGSGIDPDGYTAVVRRAPDSLLAEIGPSDERRFSPLAAGRYVVALQGLATNCALAGTNTDTVDVTDQGLQTLALVAYTVGCRDPGRGRITVTVAVDGDSLDVNGFNVQLLGLADSVELPDSLRIVAREHHVASAGEAFRFDDLLPGQYQLQLDDLAAQCTLAGSPQRDVRVDALTDIPVRYDLDCPRGTPNTGNRPFVLRNRWTPDPVPPGQVVALDLTLDLSAQPAQTVAGAQGELRYAATTLRFDSAKAGALGVPTVNAQTPGLLSWIVFTTSNPPGGVLSLARLYFTAIGAAGSTAATRSTTQGVAAGDGSTALDSLIHIIEDTVSVGGSALPPPPPPGAPFAWRGTFGALNPADSSVALTITLDLTTDIPETPGPEALATFIIDSLKWDPTVLRYFALNWGPGGAGVVQTTHALRGKLVISSFTLPASANSGVLQLATIRFKSIASGRATTTATAVGPLISTPANGAYDYRAKTNVVEATFTAP